MDLDEFAVSQGKTKNGFTRCLTCNLNNDILAQINEGRRREPKPVPYPTISKWLESEHGIKIQQATIRNHFVAGHAND